MTYQFLPAAEDELTEATEWYDAQEQGLGHSFAVQVRSALARMLATPEGWSFIGRGYRCCRLNVYPYGLVYRTHGNVLVIVSVFHLSLRPGTWRKNLKRS